MPSIPGAKVVLQSVRTAFVYARLVTRFGRRITRTTIILIIDFTFTFTLGVWKMKVDLRPAIQLS